MELDVDHNDQQSAQQPKSLTETDKTPDFDAEWEQFEAELSGKGTSSNEQAAVSYPQFQTYTKPVDDVYASSFAVEASSKDENGPENASDDSAAYSPSSEPIPDLFKYQREEKLAAEGQTTQSQDSFSSKGNSVNRGDEETNKDNGEKSKRHRERSRSRSRSKGRDRSHKSKRESYRSRHHRSRSRSRSRARRRNKSHRSRSSSSSRSRSRSGDRHRRGHRKESSHSDRRRRDDEHSKDGRKRSSERGGLSAATVGNYGPRSVEQMEKQRQLNAAVLNEKQTKRTEKGKPFNPGQGPRRNGSQDGPSASGGSDSGTPSFHPGRPAGGFQKKKFDPKMTPQERAAAIQKHVEDLTGIQMPKYYNPTAINPLKYAEQMQKRKLLWSKAKEGKTENESLWQNTAMALEGSSSNKFQKLMGLKSSSGDDEAEVAPQKPVAAVASDSRRKQDQLFDQLDREYEFARITTHTHRGMGLGFQSAAAEKATTIASINSKPTASVIPSSKK